MSMHTKWTKRLQSACNRYLHASGEGHEHEYAYNWDETTAISMQSACNQYLHANGEGHEHLSFAIYEGRALGHACNHAPILRCCRPS